MPYTPISNKEAAFWRRVRRQFFLPDDEIYLNTGTLSSVPKRAIRAVIETLKRTETNPTIELHKNWELETASRTRIARYLGAQPTEIVFFSNVTIGLNALFRGLPLSGGETLFSNQEYGSCVNALRFVAERRGMTARQFTMPLTPSEPREVVDSVLAALTPETRLVYVSHITCGTGMVVPVGRIGEELAARGVMFAVDGAHAPGQIPLDLDGMRGVSAYGGNLHKWFLGPKGTAFAWVPARLHDEMGPLMVGFGGFRSRRPAEGTGTPPPPVEFHRSFRMPGCLDFSPWIGLAATLDFRERIGEERILARLRQLAAYCRETFARELGWKLRTPTHPELSGVISSFEMPAAFPLPEKNAIQWFYDRHRITASFIGGEGKGIRVSPHIYSSESDIDRLVECLKMEMKGA